MEFTTGGRLEVAITPADVGKRVSVRRLAGPGESTERFTDTVGVLTSWDDGVLSITRRTGEEVRIAESALVAGKVVPAAPARRRGPATSVRELTAVAARGWPATETEQLGEWTLRAAAGFSRRANSVLVTGDPGVPLDEALDRVRAWYAARGLTPYIAVATGAAGGDELLAAELERRGWTAEARTVVRVGALAPLADTGADTGRVRLSREPDDAWTSLYNRTADAPPEARKVLAGGPSVWFATVPGETGPAAIGRVVVDGRWAGFAAVEVAPEHRRQGLATLVMAALAQQALAEGASAAYLQVEADNDGARALYDALGFTDHHHYHYRRAPQAHAR
ncbi:GNAT family N-acetyltransferase [Streptomyces sp. Ru73]|uniref:GNAT family N-acetyltransferase n=1 Tax=Streptomyces sp. Ru73 TaxID=2080748 RepID=UPI000CDD1CB2|nr:GNAT family N-acetyltransferase [Streptomyces sp. Ru73]POX40485.1 GNAT family N-acetyltransferase [Streptomyces sp. Ru73]